MIKNPDLAKTFEAIAKDSGKSFYNGSIAENILSTIKNDFLNPGVMNLNDLTSYEAVERKPVKFSFNGYDIYTMNMPSSAATIPLGLNILEEYGFNHSSLTADAVRDILNAMSIAFGIYLKTLI